MSATSLAAKYLLRWNREDNTRWATACGSMPNGRKCRKRKGNGTCPNPQCIGHDTNLILKTEIGFRNGSNGNEDDGN